VGSRGDLCALRRQAVLLYKQAVAWRITSPNQPVHLTPKARAFFTLAVSEQNFAFAKSSLAFGAGDQHVRPRNQA